MKKKFKNMNEFKNITSHVNTPGDKYWEPL